MQERYSDLESLFSGEKRVAVKKTGYKYKAVVYAELYGMTARTLQRYNKKAGEERLPPPPWDNPPALRGWWKKFLKKEPPGKVLKVVSLCDFQAEPPIVPNESDQLMEIPPAPEEKEDKIEIDMDSLETSASSSLERIRRAEAVAGQRLQMAYEKGIDVEIDKAAAQYEKASKMRAMYEGKIEDQLKKSKQLFPRESVLRIFTEVNMPVFTKVKTFLADFLRDEALELTEEQAERWGEAVERLVSGVHLDFQKMTDAE